MWRRATRVTAGSMAGGSHPHGASVQKIQIPVHMPDIRPSAGAYALHGTSVGRAPLEQENLSYLWWSR